MAKKKRIENLICLILGLFGRREEKVDKEDK